MVADLGVLLAVLGIAGLAGLAGWCFGYNRGQSDAWMSEGFEPDPERVVPLKRVA